MKYNDASTDAALFHLVREYLDLPVIARFTIDGEPVSKARARFTGYGSKIRSYTPDKTLAAEAAIEVAFRKAAPNHKPDPEVTYGLTALFFSGTRQRRDVDNMLKLICDGLNQVAWVDDSHVVEVSGRKSIEAPAHARTEVLIYRVGFAHRLTLPCQNCGEHFQIHPSGSKRKFCTRACAYAFRTRERPACAVCGEPVKDPASTHCSYTCLGVSRRKPTPRCVRCGAGMSGRKAKLCRPCYETRGEWSE